MAVFQLPRYFNDEVGGVKVKLATGLVEGHEELLCVTPSGAIRVRQMAERYGESNRLWTMQALLRQGPSALVTVSTWEQKSLEDGMEPDHDYELLAPVTRPGKIVCVGLNYRPHVAEANFEVPTHPVLFNKFPNSAVGSGATVAVPTGARQMDYEAELVVVMGKRCSRVPEAEALDYVLGYCNGNDISARDLQFRTSQWLLGKAADGFGPMGPYLVTGDEMPDPDALEITGKRNGVVVQHSNTREMIFSCRYLISYLSHYMTLEPGDVIFTGTPEGVILGRPVEDRRWLSRGDRLTVAIEGLGELDTYIG